MGRSYRSAVTVCSLAESLPAASGPKAVSCISTGKEHTSGEIVMGDVDDWHCYPKPKPPCLSIVVVVCVLLLSKCFQNKSRMVVTPIM